MINGYCEVRDGILPNKRAKRTDELERHVRGYYD
jgi:hypothetical protein